MASNRLGVAEKELRPLTIDNPDTVDSNVLISALLIPDGTPRHVLDRLAANAANLLFSDETFTELAVRLAKPNFDSYRTTERMSSFSGLAEPAGRTG